MEWKQIYINKTFHCVALVNESQQVDMYGNLPLRVGCPQGNTRILLVFHYF